MAMIFTYKQPYNYNIDARILKQSGSLPLPDRKLHFLEIVVIDMPFMDSFLSTLFPLYFAIPA